MIPGDEGLLDLLDDVNAALHACDAVGEAYPLIADAAVRLFGETNGALALVTHDAELETVTQWGSMKSMAPAFALGDCVGLRRRGLHIAGEPGSEAACHHFTSNLSGPSVCVPLTAGGDTMGLLHLDGNLRLDTEEKRRLTHFGNVVQVALSDLKLRESLRTQAVRDPLTGLFNRLYLDETLPRECRLAKRRKTRLSVAMLDVDYFKRFNDSYGHQAGDAVLRALGVLLGTAMRGTDIACRYGGDEFVVVLLDSDLQAAAPRLEQICREIKRRQCVYRGALLPAIAVSVGVAEFPTHGGTPDEIVGAADVALYAAKNAGRDRIVLSKGQDTGVSQ